MHSHRPVYSSLAREFNVVMYPCFYRLILNNKGAYLYLHIILLHAVDCVHVRPEGVQGASPQHHLSGAVCGVGEKEEITYSKHKTEKEWKRAIG